MRTSSRKVARYCEGDGQAPCPHDALGGRYRGMTDLYQCEACYRAWSQEGGWDGQGADTGGVQPATEAPRQAVGPSMGGRGQAPRYPWDEDA